MSNCYCFIYKKKISERLFKVCNKYKFSLAQHASMFAEVSNVTTTLRQNYTILAKDQNSGTG